MTIPDDLWAITEDERFFRKVGIWLDGEAKKLTGCGYDLDVWQAQMPTLIFHLVVLSHFLGTWENSGSFVNEAVGWGYQKTRVKEALEAFGCETTSALFDSAAQLGRLIENQYDSGQDITDEQATRRDEINRTAEEDVSYEKLAAFIRKDLRTRLIFRRSC